MAAYDQGDRVRFTAVFQDVNEVDKDPTVVTFKIKNPAGTVTTYTYGTDADVVKDSVGNYHIDLDIASTGIYYYRWAGTGAVVAAEEESITVRASEF